MVGDGSAGRRLVIAPLVAALSVLAAVVLGVLGGWLLAIAGGATLVSVGIAAWWVGLNVLIVGLLSGSAWRRTHPVVGGERVAAGVLARAHPLTGRFHGVALAAPEGSRPRELHGFVSLRAADAELLADRLNELLRPAPGAAVAPEAASARADDPVVPVSLPAGEPDPGVRTHPSRTPTGPQEPGPAAAEPAQSIDADTIRLRRGLPLVAALPGAVAADSDAADVEDAPSAPRHGGGGEAGPDREPVVPRRARRD